MLRIPGAASPLRRYLAKRMTVVMPPTPFDRFLKSVDGEADLPPGATVLVFPELLHLLTYALPLLDSIVISISTHLITRATLPPP
jgi:hypothetical protein